MSHQLYNKVWGDAVTTLSSAAGLDAILQSAKPEKDKKLSHSIVSGLYAKYALVVNKLDICYDQMVQPQKRLLIRKLLDASIGRLLEIKHELVNLDLSEYNYMDGALVEMRILPVDAEVVVPRYYRRHRQHQINSRKTQLEAILKKLGVYDEQQPTSVEEGERRRAALVEEVRRGMQVQYQASFEAAMDTEKKRVQRLQGFRLTKEITDEVRNWVMEYKNETGKFPDLPAEEAGGSALLFGKQGTESEVSKSTTGSSSREAKTKKDKTKKPKEKETKKTKASNGDDGEDPGFKMQPSSFLTGLLAANSEYDEVWRGRPEQHNPLQRHYLDMVQVEKQQEVEHELRRNVDEALRCELELLKAALDRDRAKKGKKIKKGGKKKGRKGGKKGKKKREKDLTPDRTLDSLFEEMVTQGIIKRYPDTPLSAFYGECSFAACEQRRQGRDPTPCLGDVRRLVNQYCILPLGSREIHQSCPLVRSLLLAGPAGSGKHMLLHAVCSELGAVLFDLSPANLAGKYPGKAGLTMLVHLVNKVSRLVQPSVLFMDSAEKPFMKKVPKQDRTDPKRLKKDLPKIVKGIGPDDQIILIGSSNNPWECDQKSLSQAYNKFILLHKPDYGTLSSLWKDKLLQFPAVSRLFNVAAMAKVSDGFPMGTVVQVINEVLTCKRILQLKTHPLTHAEFVNCLAKYDPIYREEEEAFQQWYSKTPLGKKKARAQELEEEMKAEKEKRKKKK